MTISFILPTYNESESIEAFYAALTDELKKHKQYKIELLFINDGSRDDSLEKLQKLAKKDKRVKILNFSRNFGHQAAISAGLDYAIGDAAVIMDTDLQDPPAVAMELVEKWQEGFHVVYGKRKTRKDGLFKRWSAGAFYLLIDKLTTFDLPRNVGDFRLLDRKAIDAITAFREHNRYMRGIVAYAGFRQSAVEFDRDERFAGETHYPLRKMIKLALDGIFSFSTVPLKLITQFGFWVSGVNFLLIMYALYSFFTHNAVPGWTMQIISTLFIGGVQMIMLGILGEYLGRIYSEVQRRPLYIVQDVIGDESQGAINKLKS